MQRELAHKYLLSDDGYNELIVRCVALEVGGDMADKRRAIGDLRAFIAFIENTIYEDSLEWQAQTDVEQLTGELGDWGRDFGEYAERWVTQVRTARAILRMLMRRRAGL